MDGKGNVVFLVALGVHVIFAARWSLFSIFAFWSSGSWAVAFQLAGQFSCFSLLAVTVASTAVSFTIAEGFWARSVGVFTLLCSFSLLFMTSYIVSLAPIFGHSIAMYLMAFFAIVIVTACVVCRQRTFAALVTIYAAWAVAELFFGLILGYGLQMAGSTLLADAADHVENEWFWAWVFIQTNFAMSLLEPFVQCSVCFHKLIFIIIRRFGSLWYDFPEAEQHLLEEAQTESQLVPAVEFVEHSMPDDPESRDQLQDGVDSLLTSNPSSLSVEPLTLQSCAQPSMRRAGTVSRARHSRVASTCLSLRMAVICAVLTAYVSWLLAGISGFLWFQIFPPGNRYITDGPRPPCSGCYCQPIFHRRSITARGDVTYGEAERRKGMRKTRQALMLDIWKSSNLNPSIAAPAVVVIHGGNFWGGGKRFQRVKDEAIHFARHGFVVFSIDYRLEATHFLVENAAVRDAIYDAKAAVRYIVKNAEALGVDANRIAVWGSSAGGIIAASMSYVAAEGTSGNPGYPSNISAAVGLSGCLWPLVLGTADRWPSETLTPVPWFDVHGSRDTVVFPFLPAITHTFLKVWGAQAKANILAIVKGAGHVPWGRSQWDARDALRPHIQAFLVYHLRLEDRNHCMSLMQKGQRQSIQDHMHQPWTPAPSGVFANLTTAVSDGAAAGSIV